MSGTRSPFPTALRTEQLSALIVAHGSPSAPDGPETAVRALAAQTSLRLPGWTVRGATLAAEGALETALDEIPSSRLLIYPFFMSDGWFVRNELPRRLRRHRENSWEILAPFGHDRAIPALCLRAVQTVTKSTGIPLPETTVLLAAHGSRSAPQPRAVAERTARILAASEVFGEVRVGFLEEAPAVSVAARLPAPSVCLPLFTGRAGHVEIDLPRELNEASWSGTVLEPVGTWPEIPDLVATALLRSQTVDRGASFESVSMRCELVDGLGTLPKTD